MHSHLVGFIMSRLIFRDAYKQNMDPLSGKVKETMVTENVLLREVLWMLMGVSRLCLFKFNGKFFVPKPDIAVMHLSQVTVEQISRVFTDNSKITFLKVLHESICCGYSYSDEYATYAFIENRRKLSLHYHRIPTLSVSLGKI